MKTCKKCNETKNESEFYKNKSKLDGLTIYCKFCSIDKEKAWHKKNPKVKQMRNKKYLITQDGNRMSVEVYESMIIFQNHKCGICVKDMDRPYIDHDHITNSVRMLLCHQCNSMLGFAKDDIKILEKGIEYLKKFTN